MTPPQLKEQEHVEWGVDWGPDGNSVSIIKRLADGDIEVVGWEYAPHPPQRKPLTDEDLRKLADKHLFYQPEGYEVSGVFALARAIEAAHNIKENT